MKINFLDFVFFIGFFLLVVSVSLWKSRTRKGSKGSSADYFLAGRNLTWPLIGISIVAANISTEQFVGMAGQGAGSVGLAVSAWQLIGSIGIVIIAFTLLPRFLQAGIYTMPEFLEYRYNPLARSIMAIFTVIIYAVVLLTAVLYSGGLTLHTIFGFPLVPSIWAIGAIATLYTAWGGLKAVAWADLFQGLALIVGGLITFAIGLHAVGGWSSFVAENQDRLHMILPGDHPDLPWTGVASGMWIVILYYCGLNQFIVQRNLSAKTLRDGQMGVIFAGALWLIVPFAIVIPGMISSQLYGATMDSPDQAYPTLIRELIPAGLRGFMFAAIAGAVISSLGSMLNSTSTIFAMDVYNKWIHRSAPDAILVRVGRITIFVTVILGCLLAPMLADPSFGGVFQFIQQFQGYIWPGVVAAFTMAFLLPKAPGIAGVVALLCGPLFYGILQAGYGSWHQLHFLIQVMIAYLVVCGLVVVITLIRPLDAPRVLPKREGFKMETGLGVKLAGAAVIVGVLVFFIVFW